MRPTWRSRTCAQAAVTTIPNMRALPRCRPPRSARSLRSGLDASRCDQRVDRGIVVTSLAQNLAAVLALTRRFTAHRERVRLEHERRRIEARAVVARANHSACCELPVPKRFGECQDRRDAAVDTFESCAPFVPRGGCENRGERFAHAFAFVAGRELKVDEIGPPERLAEQPPEFRLERAHGEPSAVAR